MAKKTRRERERLAFALQHIMHNTVFMLCVCKQRKTKSPLITFIVVLQSKIIHILKIANCFWSNPNHVYRFGCLQADSVAYYFGDTWLKSLVDAVCGGLLISVFRHCCWACLILTWYASSTSDCFCANRLLNASIYILMFRFYRVPRIPMARKH